MLLDWRLNRQPGTVLSQQDFSLFFVFLVPLRVSKNSCSATGDGWKRPPTLPFTHHAHRGTRLYLFFPTNHRSSVYVAYNCCTRPKTTTQRCPFTGICNWNIMLPVLPIFWRLKVWNGPKLDGDVVSRLLWRNASFLKRGSRRKS